MTPQRKAFRIAQARLNLAHILEETGGDIPKNADIAAAESRLYHWLSRQPEGIKVALREYFGAEHIP